MRKSKVDNEKKSVNEKSEIVEKNSTNDKSKNYKIIDGIMCASTSEMCEKIGIDRKTLNEWSAKGCPKAARGWWPIFEVLAWRGILNKKGDSDGMAGNDEYSINIKKLKLDTELKKEKVENARFKNELDRGEYVKKSDVIYEIKRVLTVLKRSMTGYSRKIAGDISPYVSDIDVRRIERMIADDTNNVLRQISINGVYKGDEINE